MLLMTIFHFYRNCNQIFLISGFMDVLLNTLAEVSKHAAEGNFNTSETFCIAENVTDLIKANTF